MIDQEEIHVKCFNKNPEERIKALDLLKANFSSLLYKQQAWEDLHKLTEDEDDSVRFEVIDTLRSVFSQVPNKQQAWNDLARLTKDQKDIIKSRAAYALVLTSSEVPDKQQVWKNLIELISNHDTDLDFSAAYALSSAFSELPDKQQAWSDLHKLTEDENSDVRSRVAEALGSLFSKLPDKQQAWEDLHKLTKDENSDVRSEAVYAFCLEFFHFPDKQQAWNDLHRLTNDQESWVRYKAIYALWSVFSQVPNRQQAWNDLHRLTNDQDNDVRSVAANALGSVFSNVPDKQEAWNDLHRLTNDQDNDVRSVAANALGSVFSDVPEKQQAWSDLIKLINDQNLKERSEAARYLGFACSQVSDKQQAWNDLHILTNDQDSRVKYNVADALSFVFPQVPDKYQVWKDLFNLTKDQDGLVRAYANHSLGKVSIFDASQAENEKDYKRELENAIEFFEKASKESYSVFDHWGAPSRFCLPFYRSFHTLLFKKQEETKEVEKNLKEAKAAIGGSKSKELLFEAVEILANRLKEIQNLEDLDLEAKKSELNFYRQYCERVAEIMIDAEEKVPFSTMIIKKGLPIIDKNLKWICEEIQKKAKIACKESKGTDTEEIACTINREIQNWEICSQQEMAFNVESLVFTLESNVPRVPENQHIFNRIQQIREQKDVSKQYVIISTIIPLIPKLYMEQTVGELKNDIKEIKETVNYAVISLKPGIKEEIEISVGTEVLGTGVTHKITIPLQEISYSELKEDLEKTMGTKIDKFSTSLKISSSCFLTIDLPQTLHH